MCVRVCFCVCMCMCECMYVCVFVGKHIITQSLLRFVIIVCGHHGAICQSSKHCHNTGEENNNHCTRNTETKPSTIP